MFYFSILSVCCKIFLAALLKAAIAANLIAQHQTLKSNILASYNIQQPVRSFFLKLLLLCISHTIADVIFFII